MNSNTATYDIVTNSNDEKEIVTKSHPMQESGPEMGEYKVLEGGYPIVVRKIEIDRKDGRMRGRDKVDILVGAKTWEEALNVVEEEMNFDRENLTTCWAGEELGNSKFGNSKGEVSHWVVGVEEEVKHKPIVGDIPTPAIYYLIPVIHSSQSPIEVYNPFNREEIVVEGQNYQTIAEDICETLTAPTEHYWSNKHDCYIVKIYQNENTDEVAAAIRIKPAAKDVQDFAEKFDREIEKNSVRSSSNN